MLEIDWSVGQVANRGRKLFVAVEQFKLNTVSYSFEQWPHLKLNKTVVSDLKPAENLLFILYFPPEQEIHGEWFTRFWGQNVSVFRNSLGTNFEAFHFFISVLITVLNELLITVIQSQQPLSILTDNDTVVCLKSGLQKIRTWIGRHGTFQNWRGAEAHFLYFLIWLMVFFKLYSLSYMIQSFLLSDEDVLE